jgi:superfamily II DNA/RNA helicase
MAADNTYLVDKKTIHGPKIEELKEILREIVIESGEKMVIFTQWLKMAELVENVLKKCGIEYVHLNGSVPSKQRKGLIAKFKENSDCKVFLSTDAGGVGLNLQSGSVVVNMDIPWNPAVLEQRIGRVHRLGQHKTVRVINFVSATSIEQRILSLLKFKKSVFTGALDDKGEDVVMVGESQMKKLMQSVETITEDLEKADPAQEREKQREAQLDKEASEEEESISEKGGEEKAASTGDGKGVESLNDLLLSGAQFLTNLSKAISQPPQTGAKPIESQLGNFIGKDEQTGKSYLKIPLPETDVVKNIFSALGELIK